jgi:hypothetical protein
VDKKTSQETAFIILKLDSTEYYVTLIAVFTSRDWNYTKVPALYRIASSLSLTVGAANVILSPFSVAVS